LDAKLNPCKTTTSGFWVYLGDFVEMHLPHKISRDTACDLPVLTLNDESCGKNDWISIDRNTS
jgi:hypothetical protein